MAQILTTGDENAGQEMSVPVPGRASPLRVRATPGSEIPLSPLSTVLFADATTTTPLASQNGSIATPFATAQQAVDELATGFTIELTPGNYGSATVVNDKSITFLGLASQSSFNQPEFVSIEVTDAAVYFQNVNATFVADASLIEFYNARGEGTGTNASSLIARDSQLTGPLDGLSLVRAFNCDVNVIDNADEVTLDECALSGDITSATSLTIRNVRTVQPGLTLTAANIVLDVASFSVLIGAGTVLTGTLTIIGTSEVIRWGASALAPAPASSLQPWVKTVPTAGFGNQWILVPVTGRIGNLRARVFNVHTQNITFTVFHNLAATAVAVTIPSGAFNAVNGTNFLDVVAGDILSLDGVAADALGAATSIEVEVQLYGT